MNATTERPRRQAKPLQPVNVRAVFVGGATRDDVIAGQAVLSIKDGDDDESAYWCRAIFTGERCTSFQLTKFGTGEVYDLPRNLAGCDCPDRTFKSERPGGCKHMVALKQALPTVTSAGPVVRKRDRKTERDEVTMAEQQ